MADTNSDAKQEKRFIDPATGAPSGSSSSGGITGSGTEAGNQTTSTKGNGTEKPDTSAFGEGRSEPGGNIGGRNPGTSSKTIGDQDSTQGRNDMDMVDPMTGRSPGQLDKIIQQDNSREIAERDP
jgi:hypothetical protein